MTHDKEGSTHILLPQHGEDSFSKLGSRSIVEGQGYEGSIRFYARHDLAEEL